MKKLTLKEQINEIKDLFENKLHSLQMIADIFKVSRQSIKKELNKAGVCTNKERSKVSCECVVCGKKFFKPRARKRNQTGWNDYCSIPCYYKFLEGIGQPDSRQSRQAARLKMAIQILGTLKLPPGAIVHHIDGDQNNNATTNLMLLVSQAAHIRFHRACPVEASEIIYDGRFDSAQHRKEAAEKVYIMLGERF